MNPVSALNVIICLNKLNSPLNLSNIPQIDSLTE